MLSFRVELTGAAAVRVHFQDFHLPPGAQVYVYGLNSNGVAASLAGPYQASGRLLSGDVWSSAVPGPVAVVELQTPEPLPTLPFEIREAAALAAMPENNIEDPPVLATQAVSWIHGVPTRYAIRDGWAIWEGDILLAPATELIDASTGKVAPRAAAAVVSPWNLWPGGVVPYTIHPQLPNPARATAAIAHWNTQLSGSLRLVPRTTESAYVTFQPASPTMCASYIGRIGVPAQPIYAGAYCSTGNLIHEIGHAIGLFHEHTRQDRDRYVRILSENLDPATAYNFQVASNSAIVGSYDFGSIMHYGPYSFSINGKPTIVTVPAGIFIGQRSSLSPGDLGAVRSLYPPAPVSAPLAAPIPTGRVRILGQWTTIHQDGRP